MKCYELWLKKKYWVEASIFHILWLFSQAQVPGTVFFVVCSVITAKLSQMEQFIFGFSRWLYSFWCTELRSGQILYLSDCAARICECASLLPAHRSVCTHSNHFQERLTGTQLEKGQNGHTDWGESSLFMPWSSSFLSNFFVICFAVIASSDIFHDLIAVHGKSRWRSTEKYLSRVTK